MSLRKSHQASISDLISVQFIVAYTEVPPTCQSGSSRQADGLREGWSDGEIDGRLVGIVEGKMEVDGRDDGMKLGTELGAELFFFPFRPR